jgi:hypothetical protein
MPMNITLKKTGIFIGTLLLCPRLLIDSLPGNGTDSEVGSTKQSSQKRRKIPNDSTFSGLHPSSCFAPLLREHSKGIVNLYQRLCYYAYKNASINTMPAFLFCTHQPSKGLETKAFWRLFSFSAVC